MRSPLEIKKVSKRYGSLLAVDQVSFSIEVGEVFGLLGPNGAGKTSIISMITTLELPTDGDIFCFGFSVKKEAREVKYRIGCVPQELVNYGFFNVEEILKFQSGYYGIWNNQLQIDYLLDRLGLFVHRKKKVKELSGGLKRRLLIAKSLVHKPKLLLLDEPTAGVDIELRGSLWEFIQELKENGTAVLLTTHYLEEAENICDRIAFLDQGVIKLVGSTKELIQGYTFREITLFLKNQVDLFSHPNLVDQKGQALMFRLPSSVAFGDLLLSLPISLEDIQDIFIKEGSLEDVFQQVVIDG